MLLYYSIDKKFEVWLMNGDVNLNNLYEQLGKFFIKVSSVAC